MSLMDPLVVILILAALLILAGYLVSRLFGAGRRVRDLPLLAEVGVHAGGGLACPVCGATSFVTPPSRYRGLFALALGPFVFGSLSSSGTHLVECVVCASCFRRGVPAGVPAVSGVTAPPIG